MKKFLFILLIAIMLNVANVFAQECDYSGTTGTLQWCLKDGTLTISGEGTMPDYVGTINESTTAPWYGYNSYINTIVVEIGVTSIGNLAFAHCKNLTLVTIPNSITSIGASFGGCESLPSVTIPYSVTSIGDFAFIWCESLTSIDVESENSYYFSENGVLFNKSYTTLICCPAGKTGEYIISNGVTSIKDFAFDNCKNLISVTIPNSVKSIEEGAFSYCRNLTLVTNLNPVPIEIDSLVFQGVNKSECTLEVPKGSVSAYKEAEVWKEFNIVGIDVGIVETDNAPSVRVYPNPTNGQLIVSSEQLTVNNVEIMDILGRTVETAPLNPPEGGRLPSFGGVGRGFDISHLPSGIYFLRIQTENGAVVRKIIRN
jgi:hypothetical protein